MAAESRVMRSLSEIQFAASVLVLGGGVLLMASEIESSMKGVEAAPMTSGGLGGCVARHGGQRARW